MSETTKKPGEGMMGRYYAKAGKVWKEPIRTPHPDGTSSITVGFPVCTLSEYVEGGEQLMADMLNQAESLEQMRGPIDTMRAVIENRGSAYPTDEECIKAMVGEAMKLFAIEVRSRTALSALSVTPGAPDHG